ncbi:MAG: hypothetical protein ACUVVU_04650 [Tepidimonas sp.]|uniref:hypothetical protein n=1 Tax=Tepidimonas sp. TaxID=2002775 RepID=UPI004054EA7E
MPLRRLPMGSNTPAAAPMRAVGNKRAPLSLQERIRGAIAMPGGNHAPTPRRCPRTRSKWC